jgi:hypothetical protein
MSSSGYTQKYETSAGTILIRGILVVYQITVYRVVIDSHKHN